MKCPRCQHENRFGAKFCEECAAPLARTCSNCGSQLSAIAKFCPECAHPVAGAAPQPRFASPGSYTPQHLAEKILTSRSALEGERKQVTVLFADLKGSMELLADRDPEEARKLLDPVLEQMMEAVHRYEGTVNQVMGDGIMALFGAPLAHEDHAVRACYVALRMQESVKKYAEEVRRSHAAVVKIRVGLNSGEVVVRAIGSDLHMDYTAVGQTTHLAARMEQLAEPGTTVLTPATLALAEDFVQMKSLGPMREKVTGKLLSLDRALEAALPALLALLDVPVGDESWTGLDPPQRRQRTLDAVKGLLLRESHVQPLVVIFEDLHWIDGETQAVLEGLVESLPTARVLLLANYRPEYQHSWGSKTYYRQIRIDALSSAGAEELLEALLGRDSALDRLKQLLIDRTDGNPFFLEENARALVERNYHRSRRRRVTDTCQPQPQVPGRRGD